jgi:ubiquinone/menaquinone biosynthesis C-methylase UbiE
MKEITSHDIDMAPCLKEGAIADSASSLIHSARIMSAGPTRLVAKSLTVCELFAVLDHCAASGVDPIPFINEALSNLSSRLKSIDGAFPEFERWLGARSEEKGITDAEIEDVTGALYGNLFGAFSASSFFDEPKSLLKTRLDRNDISPSFYVGKSVLDSGCGGGRYSVAWKLLGADKVEGIDLSESNIEDATKRVGIAGIEGVSFRQGNALSLPYENEEFDVVFSNGVLHCSTDWRVGVRELVRVLKPGGFGWLYLIESPGGLYWDLIEVMRVLMNGEDRRGVQRILSAIGVPANRIFFMLDHVLVPVNVRLTEAEIANELVHAGAKDPRRLLRGADFDRIERLHNKMPFAETLYGAGEHRFVFSK